MYSWQKCIKGNIGLVIIKMYLPDCLINLIIDLTNFRILFIIIIYKLFKMVFCYINFL